MDKIKVLVNKVKMDKEVSGHRMVDKDSIADIIMDIVMDKDSTADQEVHHHMADRQDHYHKVDH